MRGTSLPIGRTNEKSSTMNTESTNEPDFSTIVAFASALGLGAMLALSQALRINSSDVSFHLSIWSGIAFLMGFNVAFAYLRFVFAHGDKTPRLFRRGGLVVLVAMAAGALLYPLRSFPFDVLADRFAGLAAALCFIAAGLTLIWRIVLVAQNEEDEQEAKEHSAPNTTSYQQESNAAANGLRSRPVR